LGAEGNQEEQKSLIPFYQFCNS